MFNDSALTYSVSWTDPNSSNSKNYPTWCLSQIWRFILRPLTHRCDAVVMQCRLSKWLQVELFSSFYSLGAGSCFDSLLRSWPISSLQNPSCFSFFLPFCPSLLLYPPWKLVNLQTRLCFPFLFLLSLGDLVFQIFISTSMVPILSVNTHILSIYLAIPWIFLWRVRKVTVSFMCQLD